MKHIHKITSHFLLSHDNFLSSIDNKITSLVIRTLSFGNYLSLSHIVQNTELRSDHNGNLTDWYFLLNLAMDQLVLLIRPLL